MEKVVSWLASRFCFPVDGLERLVKYFNCCVVIHLPQHWIQILMVPDPLKVSVTQEAMGIFLNVSC